MTDAASFEALRKGAPPICRRSFLVAGSLAIIGAPTMGLGEGGADKNWPGANNWVLRDKDL